MTAGLSATPAAHGGRSCLPYLLVALVLHAGVLALPLDWKPPWQQDLQAPSGFSARLSIPAAEPATPVPPVPAAPTLAAPRETQARSRLAVPSASPVSPVRVQPAAPAVEATAAAGAPTTDASLALRPPAPASSPARFDAAYLNNPQPAYPAASRRLGEEGRVLLRVRVGADGRPVAVDVEKASQFSRLDEAARDAVARWHFVPARRGDEAVEGSVLVPLVFRLDH